MTLVNDEAVSKSARKREHLAEQALGEKLIELPIPELKSMDLDERLFEAIVDAKSIRSHGALRRQRQLIGKLMRNADAERIESALEALGRRDRLAKAVFHAAEEWRERLCHEGAPALAAFAGQAGTVQPRLGQLLGEYEAAVSETGKRVIRRRLFREIHQVLQEIETEGCTSR
jgi:ribosome-associated protein